MTRKKVFLTLICVLFSVCSAKGMKTPRDDKDFAGFPPTKRLKLTVKLVQDEQLATCITETPREVHRLSFVPNTRPSGKVSELLSDDKIPNPEYFMLGNEQENLEILHLATVSYNMAFEEQDQEKVRTDFRSSSNRGNPVSSHEIEEEIPLHKIKKIRDLFPSMKEGNYRLEPATHPKYGSAVVNLLYINDKKVAAFKYLEREAESSQEYEKHKIAYTNYRQKCQMAPIVGRLILEQDDKELQENNPFIIIFKAAKGEDIYSILSHYPGDATNAVVAVACSLAKFHCATECTLDQPKGWMHRIAGKIDNLEQGFIPEETTRPTSVQAAIFGLTEEIDYLNHPIFSTSAHGDANGGNFISFKGIRKGVAAWLSSNYKETDYRGSKGWMNSIPFLLSEDVTFIDYAAMAEKQDPTQDVGFFIGSLWQWGARDSHKEVNDLCPMIQKWEEDIISNYITFLKDNKGFEERIVNYIKNGIARHKFRFLKKVLEASKNKQQVKMLNRVAQLCAHAASASPSKSLPSKLMDLFWRKGREMETSPSISFSAPEETPINIHPNKKSKDLAKFARAVALNLYQPLIIESGENDNFTKAQSCLNKNLTCLYQGEKPQELHFYIKLLENISLNQRENIISAFQNHLKKTKKLSENFTEDDVKDFYESIIAFRKEVYYEILSAYSDWFKPGITCIRCEKDSMVMTKVAAEHVGECWVCGHEKFF